MGLFSYHPKGPKTSKNIPVTLPLIDNSAELRKYAQVLSEIGMKKSLTGYNLWQEALYIYRIHYKNSPTFKIQDIYEKLALEYDSNISRVERNLRHARITAGIKMANKDMLIELYEKSLEY